MKHSLKRKLILSFLAVALITVVVVSALIRLTSGQSLMSLVVEQQVALLKENVETYYANHATMEGFIDSYNRSQRGDNNPAPLPVQEKPPKQRDTRAILGLVDEQYRALLPTIGYDVGQVVPREKLTQATPVNVDGKTIAWILPDTQLQFKLSSEEELFLQRTTLAITLAALAGILVAVVMGFILSNNLLKPIRRLTRASQSLASGNLEQQVPVTSQDELGQLTATFNQMSADLARADGQRKRLTADITHDLSTPLQVISGYMEMLEAGEVALTPQRIEIIKTEIDHLRRLVGDLSTLTQVEANGLDIQLQPVNVAALMERTCQSFQPIAARQGIELILDAHSSSEILVDEGRMLQVLKNLVENALRYTPAGGSIRLITEDKDRVLLKIIDSGTGIEAEDLPFVFDRFYQADKARGSQQGKMGLGLAICKALVTAQNGTISAQSEGKGRGTTFTLAFDPAPA